MNAIMSDFDLTRATETPPQKWEGLAELDRALAENRLTEYRWKKAWADPWSRALSIFVILMFVAMAIYVVIDDFIIGH